MSKIIGSRYFNLESENINLQQIKSLKDLKVSSFKKATIAEINNLKLRSNSSFKSKYHTHPNFFKNKLMKLFNHW